MTPVLELEPGGTASQSLRALRVGRGASGGRAPACCSARSSSAPEVERERRVTSALAPKGPMASAVTGIHWAED